MNRRGFLTGLLASPAVITTPGLLMPVKAWSETWPVVIGWDRSRQSSSAVRIVNCRFSGRESFQVVRFPGTSEIIRDFRRYSYASRP